MGPFSGIGPPVTIGIAAEEPSRLNLVDCNVVFVGGAR